MKNILNKIISYQSLEYKEAKEIIEFINKGQFNDYQLVAIMTSLQMRSLHIEELRGFQDALLELAKPVDLSEFNGIDLCGTGGDSKNTFNISTTTSLVLASMGYKVVKHGNYGVSSLCGSSNVLEYLGFTFKENIDDLKEDLEKTNITFLHAPLFHPTLLKVGHLRKQLGIRTFFNSLGPLVNPAKPSYQLTGTFSLELAKIYPHLLKDKRTNFSVIFGLDGYDELTLTENTKIIGKNEDLVFNAQTFKTKKVNPEEIFGGETIQQSAQILLNILNGKGTKSQNTVIAANLATAIKCINPKEDLNLLFENSLDQILSGKSATFFKL
ncbi:MAG: anthranilate phosphoribosyltransferase [Bacteroidota bacterium]